MQDRAAYPCPTCWESIEVTVDPSAGPEQQYVEDCPVCCRPNVLRVSIDDEGVVHVTARAE
jgi:hypothetical protein